MTVVTKYNSINSRYNNTPLYETNLDDRNPAQGQVIFYGITNLPDIPETSDDVYLVVKSEHIGRWDLLSYQNYHTSSLWWLITLANNINDPFDNSIIGTTIRIPTLASVSQALGLAL